MRRGVWCSGVALLLVLCCALTTVQGDGSSRTSRRPTTTDRTLSSFNKTEDVQPTFRPRSARRREETIELSTSRSRSRSRVPEKENVPVDNETPTQKPQNVQFESRRSNSRTRRPIENEITSEKPLTRENVIRARSRQNGRRYTPSSQSDQVQSQTNRITPTIQPRVVETKYEESNINLNELPKVVPTSATVSANQFRRRSTTISTVEEAKSFRPRGRINTRTNPKVLDLEVAGTTNTFTSVARDQTISRVSDVRNSRKLRYKTRTSEIDSNLTGDGITVTNEVKSSQKNDVTSQPEVNQTNPAISVTTENIIQLSTERLPSKTSTIKPMKIVRRPITRDSSFTKSVEVKNKSKVSDEISEDDNYPESFKALIQAKNATQSNSLPSESLSVRASQKVSKTQVSPTQSIITSPGTDKNSRLRKKLKNENEKDRPLETTLASTSTSSSTSSSSASFIVTDAPKPRTVQYRSRSSYFSRNAKQEISSTTENIISSTRPSSERQYKFSRKFKSVTEPSKTDMALKTKRVDNALSKKQVIRSSLFTRKNDPVNITVIPINDNRKNDRVHSASHLKTRRTLPSTSYYARHRNKTSTDDNLFNNSTETAIADKKSESNADLPLIFTYLSSPSKSQVHVEKNITTLNITQENSTENEIMTKAEESENKFIVHTEITTQKYHANYKEDPSSAVNEKPVSSVTPAIRNIQTRKYGRKPSKTKEAANTVIFKSKDRNVRKYGDPSKTTEAPGNSILKEDEKPKNKYSSKYRASYLDKPFYKPTVPTVTPSTAWKYFATDEYSKSTEEPMLFGNDFFNVTSEFTSRMNITSPTFSHESSLERVEGEEIQLGPDMNAIAITKTRRPLSSADLRLSESLAKPSQVLNVEASQHSPSVTVSIFDALAEILTSTPKPRISSTTEILPKQKNDINKINTLDGVSSNVNVNTVTGFATQKTVTSKDHTLNTNAIFVQTTEQINPIVFNSLPVGENVTPSLNFGDEKTTIFIPSKSNTTPNPTPTPTTPISVRKPFAIKVLYSETEPTTDRTTTTIPFTSAVSTEKTTMVYNSISDLLLANNGVVSSELTSMLSNNIRSIIQNMDDESRAKLSIGMTNLLNTVVPRASPNTSQIDDDNLPSITTPYSLEDIKDTENIDITYKDTDDENNNILQNVVYENPVNSSETLNNKSSEVMNSTNSPVNSSISSDTLMLDFDREVLITSTTLPVDLNKNVQTILNDIESTTILPDMGSLITNSEVEDINLSFTNQEPIQSSPQTFAADSDNIQFQSRLPTNTLNEPDTLQNSIQVSQLQLWILSKKARVLKMIEDLLREHNNEIANPPFDNFMQGGNETINLFSSRLTDIMTSMNGKIHISDTLTTDSPPMNLPSPSTNFMSSFPASSLVTSPFFESISTTESTNYITEYSPNTLTTDAPLPATASEIANAITSVDPLISTTVSDNDAVLNVSNNIALLDTTEMMATETTTFSPMTTSVKDTEDIRAETTTFAQMITSVKDIEDTTPSSVATTMTTAALNERKLNNIKTNSNILNVATRPTIPKKDFVIFGILPNNTVVRKDPNDNPLESLTEASPYIIYGVLPNNTIIRKFPNGTRVPQIMQKIDVLPISPWNLKNPYSPIHNIPAIVRPQSNPIRVSTNTVISTDTSNNEKEMNLTTDTVNNPQVMILSSTLNIKDSSSLGITTTSTQPPAEKSTASHVLSLRTTTMLPSVDEILLNSISLATKEEMFISSMTSSTPEPRILTLDIDPETKQIRTERPRDDNGNTVFKFIPIEDVMISSTQETNVLKLASPKTTKTASSNIQMTTLPSTTEAVTQTPQIEIYTENNVDSTTISQASYGTPCDISSEVVSDEPATPILLSDTVPTTASATTVEAISTTFSPELISKQNTFISSTTTAIPKTNPTTFKTSSTITDSTTDFTESPLSTYPPTVTITSGESTTTSTFQTQSNTPTYSTERTAKKVSGFESNKVLQNQQKENAKLLEALLVATGQNTNNKPNIKPNINTQTTVRTIEDDIRQFEEDTKLLKALLQATGRDPASLNIPSLGDIKILKTTAKPNTNIQFTTTVQTTPSTTTQTTETSTVIKPTTSSINDDIKRLQEDKKLLQALLQATGNKHTATVPIISGLTSNVRIASNPLTTSMVSNPTTSFNVRPVYTTTQEPSTTTIRSQVITVSTLQPTTEDIGISTTFRPVATRSPIITTSRPAVTTEIPSSSTYSDEEDLQFLQNLKSVLSKNNKNEDPETALANRVIALAVERSLNEIQVGKSVGTTKVITSTTPMTTTKTTTTTIKTTTTRATTTPQQNIPSIEDDIKQFEQDTKLLQALLKATGQDPSKFNIPTLPTTSVSPQLSQSIDEDLKLLSNLLASPSPLNEPFDPLTQKPAEKPTTQRVPFTTTRTNIKIAVKDDLKNEQDDAKLLQTLIKLQDAQETTTMRSKLAITGHSPDEALKKLIQKAKPAGMMSESTKPSMSLSTEYGNSNDALLAALLKEQGFGPTTASSLDEQIRLAALLNQVVVTPKARRTTTPPPPPPAPRRPVLDGLAWLWQQWRDTAPGSQSPRQSRPQPTRNQPAQTASTATSSRVNWFGSGPFVGNADERPANRIPLEPPSAVEQPPGRGQLVSAAINVTRAFSQFLGAAIQGAAQTVQNVFRAGQKAASDVYTNGSGGSG